MPTLAHILHNFNGIKDYTHTQFISTKQKLCAILYVEK